MVISRRNLVIDSFFKKKKDANEEERDDFFLFFFDRATARAAGPLKPKTYAAQPMIVTG